MVSLADRFIFLRNRVSIGVRKSRKRKPLDELVLREVISSYQACELDAEEAATRLGVSVSTFSAG